MKLDTDTFLSNLALFSGVGAGVIFSFNALLYAFSYRDAEPRPFEMIVGLVLFTIYILSIFAKAVL